MEKQVQEQQIGKAQERRRLLRKRWIIFAIEAFFFTTGAIALVLSYQSIIPYNWSYVLSALFGLCGILITLYTWHFPSQSIEPKQATTATSSTVMHTSANNINTHSSITELPPTATTNPIQLDEKLLLSGRKVKVDKVQAQPNSIFQFNVKLPSRNDFYGRKRVCGTLINRAQKASPTSIVGPRRIGKTWLITYLLLMASTNKFGPRYRFGYIDASTPICSTIAGFTERALEELGIADSYIDKSSLNLATLERYVRNVSNNNQIPILCIDEFEGFVRSQEFDLSFFEGLRAIAEEAGLGLVTASKTPLIEIVSGQTKTSPFFNIFEQLNLKPFNTEEAEEFVQGKSKKANFTGQEQQFLLKHGQIGKLEWSPLRLQLVGKILLEDKNQEQCRLDDQSYQRYFEDRLNEAYKGVVP